MVARRDQAALRLTGLLLAGSLGACSAGGPLPAPEPGASADAATGVLRDPATGLALSRWPADEPKATILAVHGYGDYAESAFAAAGAQWAARGIDVVAYDQRGFGRNPSRGRWPGADALIADLKTAAARIRAADPCLPLVVVGHSMGGGVALAAAPDLDADGIVLAAPAIWGGEELNPLHRILAWTAALIAPETRFSGRGVVRIQASDNIEALRALARDPLYLSPPSAREILGLVRVADRARAASGESLPPALMLLGAKDQIVPNAAARRVFARIRGETELRVYPDGWHLLFRDLQARRVRRDAADWTLARKLAAPRPSCRAS